MPPVSASRASRVGVLIAAAGSGTRLGPSGAGGKQLLPVGGAPLLVHTVRRFQEHPRVAAIAVVTRPEDQPALERAFTPRAHWNKLLPWIAGGAERQDSVRLGLEAWPGQTPDWLLVHDGARPLCSAALVDRVLAALERHPAVVPVLPLPDTLRETTPAAAAAGGPAPGADAALGGVVDRRQIVACQTPQGFHWHTLLQAHQQAQQAGFRGTDDAQLVERIGIAVASVPGEPRNFKLTVSAEKELMEWALDRPDWGLHRE